MVALGFALAIALGGGVGALAQQQDSAPAHVETVVVQPGESLWAIAVGVSGPDEDVRDVVEQIRNLNGLHGATLQAGQELTIPVQ
ncbi:MAG TPA: LysM peptidoglycan-binding domain-containing protein [Beutenbergiaceae bacterium]|nr:LysM peptidoglycan-binding domain-containing protein [Beutenbergiaceae bacterium]